MKRIPTINPLTLIARRLPTPWPLVLRAVIILAGFAIVHALGWRATMSAVAATSGDRTVETLLPPALYAFFYFTAVLLAPILLLMAAIFALLRRLLHPRAAHPLQVHAASAQPPTR